jgi:putative transposase
MARSGAKREPVLAALGFAVEGRRVLLHLMAGSKEDTETVTAFFEDMICYLFLDICRR